MAFGFTSSDAESEHALIVAENGIHAARQGIIFGKVYEFCQDDDCGEEIPEGRRQFFAEKGQLCKYCVNCAPKHVKQIRVKMLDRVL